MAVKYVKFNTWLRYSHKFQFVTLFESLYYNDVVLILVILLFSSSAMDDLQMKELQDQLEAEQYFSVSTGGMTY